MTGGAAGGSRHRLFALAAGSLVVPFNVAATRLPPDSPVGLVSNISLAAVLLALAVRRGFSLGEVLGTGVRAGLRWGTGVSVVVALAVLGLLVAAPEVFERTEHRAARLSLPLLAYHLLVRIPFGTVLPEEAIFRGVLFAAWRREASAVRATVASSTFYGLWHMGPALASGRTAPSDGVGQAVAVAVGATFLGGATVLAPLRERTGGILATTLVHATANASGTLAAFVAAR